MKKFIQKINDFLIKYSLTDKYNDKFKKYKKGEVSLK